MKTIIERLADEKPAVSNSGKEKPEVTIMKRGEATHGGNSMIDRQSELKENAQTLSGNSRETTKANNAT